MGATQLAAIAADLERRAKQQNGEEIDGAIDSLQHQLDRLRLFIQNQSFESREPGANS
jgi:HPt (histidine-containing phosphotransfer) domain-containing protein